MTKTIINNLNYLKKISLGDNNSIVFTFGDMPNIENQQFHKYVIEPKDYFEVVCIRLQGDITKLYWKLHRYTGELMFLHLDEKVINIFHGEITNYEEDWNYFDDVEYLKSNDYDTYQVLKTAEDWKNDFKRIRAGFYSLYKKKN